MNVLLLVLVAATGFGELTSIDKVGIPPEGGSIGDDITIGDCIVLDDNGVQGCVRTTDVAPNDVLLTGQTAYPEASVNTTGADVHLAGGLGSKSVTVDDYNNCGTDTVTVTIDGSASVLTEASEWTAATSNAATATSLASAIDALTGVSASATAAVVYVTKDDTTSAITLAEGDATCTTIANGTDGKIKTFTELQLQSTLDSNDNLVYNSGGAIELGTAGTPGSAAAGDIYTGGDLEIDGVVYSDGGVVLANDQTLVLGPGPLYSLQYNSSGTKLDLTSTDCNGGGTDCIPVSIDDGTDDLVYTGNGVYGLSQRLVLDDDGDTGIMVDADDSTSFYNGTSNWTSDYSLRLTGTTLNVNVNAKLLDAKLFIFGSGTDYWVSYDNSATQLEFASTDCDGGGTDCDWLIIDDDTDDPIFSGTPTFETTERCSFIAAGADILGPTAPSNQTNGNVRGPALNIAAETLYLVWEIPSDWAGDDVKVKLYWTNQTTDALLLNETVKLDFNYGAFAGSSEQVDGASTESTTTYTETANPGNDGDSHETELTLTYNDGTNPLAAMDIISGALNRDVATDTYSGYVIVYATEFCYNSTGIPDHF